MPTGLEIAMSAITAPASKVSRFGIVDPATPRAIRKAFVKTTAPMAALWLNAITAMRIWKETPG